MHRLSVHPEVEIFGGCSRRMWALVQHVADSELQERVRRYDVALCDDAGVVAVRLKSYSTRVLEAAADPAGVVLLSPRWEAREAVAGAAPAYAERHVLLCGLGVETEALAALAEGAQCEALAMGEGLAAGYGAAVRGLCERVRDILQHKPADPVLLQVVVPAEGERQVLAG